MTRRLVVLMLLLAAARTPAWAQDVPVVFVHGIFSSSATWRDTAARLATTLRITPHLIDMPSTAVFETQTAVLNNAHAGLPASTIAVGHSQGGLISRQWSRNKALSGILTLGTPHTGSQLTARALDLINFNALVYTSAGLALGTLSTPDFAWLVYSALDVYLNHAQWTAANVATTIASSVAVAGRVPVASQLVPGSSFLAALNHSGNLTRESLTVPKRVGLSYTAHEYWRAGAAVGLSPAHRETVWHLIVYGPPTFDFVAAWLDANTAPTNYLARHFAISLRILAAYVRDMDPRWCEAVTGDRRCLIPHDGIVSVHNQVYPGAINFAVSGPAHTQETRQSDGVIASVLTGVMGVVTRGATVPTPMPTPGPGGPDTLTAGQRLYAGQQIMSANGGVAMNYQSDGNLVLYGPNASVFWDSGTHGTAPGRVEMQHDGNLVIYDPYDTPLWSSDTFAAGAYLKVHPEGYIVVHDASGVALWWSGSGQP